MKASNLPAFICKGKLSERWLNLASFELQSSNNFQQTHLFPFVKACEIIALKIITLRDTVICVDVPVSKRAK